VLAGAFSGGSQIRYTLKERRNTDGTHALWGVGEAPFGAAREPEEDPPAASDCGKA
jgi:hypothetical protein